MIIQDVGLVISGIEDMKNCHGLTDKVMLGHRLDSVISKVFSNLVYSVILWFCKNENKEEIFLETFRSEEDDGVRIKIMIKKKEGDFKKDRKRF